MIRIYKFRCACRAIELLAREDCRSAKGPFLLAISVIRSGIGGQGKNADKHFAAVNPESQASLPGVSHILGLAPLLPQVHGARTSFDRYHLFFAHPPVRLGLVWRSVPPNPLAERASRHIPRQQPSASCACNR